jgi:multimeric flavodoxin WrbA
MAMMAKADGLIIGTPVYFGGVTAQLKALMDRSMALEAKAMALRNKVAGVLTVAYDRNGGQEHTLFDMIRWLMLHDMIVVSVGADRPATGTGCFWGGSCTQGFPYPIPSPTKEAREGAQEDVIGIGSVRSVAKRVAEMTKIMKAGISTVPLSELAWPLHPTRATEALYRDKKTQYYTDQ